MRVVGYLLPIRPIQSEQYANRISMEPHNFATIGRLQRVKLTSDFLEEFKETLHLQDEEDRRKEGGKDEQSKAIPSPQLYEGYIPPNPANLSPAISQIVGKGMSVNTYI